MSDSAALMPENAGLLRTQRRAAWLRYGLVWLGLVALVVLALWDTASGMASRWVRSDTFGHCLLIVPISAWLVWQRQDFLWDVAPRPWAPGLVLVLGAGVVWMLGALAQVAVVEHFGLVFIAQALFVTIFGLSATRSLLFPLFYLVFLVPAGDQFTAPLQKLTADFSMFMLQVVDIPAIRNGIFITVPNGNFEVAEECSGVRFLIAMAALGALYANVAFKSWGRRVAVMVIAGLISVIANGFRAWGIIYIAYKTDNKVAVGVDHLVYGWVFFAFVMMLTLMVGRFFSDRGPDDPPFDVAASGVTRTPLGTSRQLATVALAALATFALVPAYTAWADGRQPERLITQMQAPQIAGWTQIEAEPALAWHPNYPTADAQVLAHYVNKNRMISLFVAAYNRQGKGKELVAYQQGAAGPVDVWTWAQNTRDTLEIDGKSQPIASFQISALPHARDVWQWWLVNGKLVTNPYAAKIEALKAKLLGGPTQAATLIVSAERADARGSAAMDMQDLVVAIGPVQPALERWLAAR